MGRKAYVECEHELGEKYYNCSVCRTDLTGLVRKNLNEIMLRILEKKLDLLNFYCPRCKKKLDFSKLGVSIQIGIKVFPAKVKKSRNYKKK